MDGLKAIAKLEEKIEKIFTGKMFTDLDYEGFLDSRDDFPFDEAWVKVDHLISQKVAQRPLTSEAEQSINHIRESVFKRVYRLCASSEVSSYLSDDFGLIGEALATGYSDKWIAALLYAYLNESIPSGDLAETDQSLTNLIETHFLFKAL